MLRDKVEKIVKRIDILYTQNIHLPDEARIDQDTLPGEAEWANFKQVLARRDKGRAEWISESGTECSIRPHPTPPSCLGLLGLLGRYFDY